ncbi:MAG TPA: hypothetical protein VED01_13305 [Burkholderiales bacterium]|nr:hypothetical protein [Burkholderiales bacterium]
MARKPTTERDGRRLAAKMLRKMETYQTSDLTGCWPWSIRAVYRPLGTQQDNVVLRHINALQGNPAALAGFCAVITDHIGQGECGGGTLYPHAYAKLTDRETKGNPEAWPTLDERGDEVTVRLAEVLRHG